MKEQHCSPTLANLNESRATPTTRLPTMTTNFDPRWTVLAASLFFFFLQKVRTIHLMYSDEWGRVEVSTYDPPGENGAWISAWLFYYSLCIFSLFMLQTLADYQESGEQIVLVSLLLLFNRAAAWQSATPQMFAASACLCEFCICVPPVVKDKREDLLDNSHSILRWILHEASNCSWTHFSI